MRRIKEIHLQHPYFGYRRIQICLEKEGFHVNKKRVLRLMKQMGLHTIYPKPKLSKPNPKAQKYPYLLDNVSVNEVHQVWSTDITYIPMKHGFLYLTAIMDWYSRYILSWELSNSLDTHACLRALDTALKTHKPKIFNSDQGSQFTSNEFTQALLQNQILISRDGKGRAVDNIFIERFWRSFKYESLYLNVYENGQDAYQKISQYIHFYNNERPHQSLLYHTPAEVFKQQFDPQIPLKINKFFPPPLVLKS